MQRFLEIPVGKETLAACLHTPRPGATSVAAPVVVCSHGLTGTRLGSCYRFVRLGRLLAEQNMACLRFDYRGCGESDGRFEDVTAFTLIEDLRAAIRAVDHLPGCDPTRIGIVASSFGAFTASQIASEIDALRCAVFWAPVAEVRELSKQQMPAAAWELLKTQGWVDHLGQRLSARFFSELPDRDGPELLAEVRKPLLVYHARGDKQVPPTHGRAYEAALKAAGVEAQFEELDAEDHGMRSVAANELLVEGTLGWMRRFLHPEV